MSGVKRKAPSQVNSGSQLLAVAGSVYLPTITATEGRPLSANREALEARYRERYPIYCATCDAHVEIDGTVGETADAVFKAFAD